MTLEEILWDAQESLLKKKNVIGVGIGFKEVNMERTQTKAIICNVSKKESLHKLKKKDVVPTKIQDVLTDVKEIGEVKALVDRKSRVRPAPGGVSVGHEKVTAGTLGCLVKKSGDTFILSNNHVLANSNEGSIGSAILQPGKADGGQFPRDRIATLSEFVPISFIGGDGECPIGNFMAGTGNVLAKGLRRKTRLKAYSTRQVENRVDCAIAKPIDVLDVNHEVLDIGIPSGWATGFLGMKVRKSGRTTELTEGEITQVNVSVQVQYSEIKIALFTSQFLIEPGGFSAPGDSGSIVFDKNSKKIVGLLFAGSDQSTIINPIDFVLTDLGVEI